MKTLILFMLAFIFPGSALADRQDCNTAIDSSWFKGPIKVSKNFDVEIHEQKDSVIFQGGSILAKSTLGKATCSLIPSGVSTSSLIHFKKNETVLNLDTDIDGSNPYQDNYRSFRIMLKSLGGNHYVLACSYLTDKSSSEVQKVVGEYLNIPCQNVSDETPNKKPVKIEEKKSTVEDRTA